MFQEDDDIEDDSLGAECKIGLSAAVRGQSEGFFLQAMIALLTPLSSGSRSIPQLTLILGKEVLGALTVQPSGTVEPHIPTDPISTFETQGQPSIPHLQRRLGKSLPLSHHQNVPRFLHTRPTTWRHPRQFGIRAPGLQIKPRKWDLDLGVCRVLGMSPGSLSFTSLVPRTRWQATGHERSGEHATRAPTS